METFLLSIPAWAYIVGIFVLCLIMYKWGRKDVVPLLSFLFEARLTFVRPTSSPRELRDTIDALTAMGLAPRMFLADDFAFRVFFPGGLIVNCTMPQAHINLGKPECGVILLSHKPESLCETAAAMVKCPLITDYNPDACLQAGVMTFLRGNRIGKLILGARRHAFFMGPKPSSWCPTRFDEALQRWNLNFNHQREFIDQIGS